MSHSSLNFPLARSRENSRAKNSESNFLLPPPAHPPSSPQTNGRGAHTPVPAFLGKSPRVPTSLVPLSTLQPANSHPQCPIPNPTAPVPATDSGTWESGTTERQSTGSGRMEQQLPSSSLRGSCPPLTAETSLPVGSHGIPGTCEGVEQ